MDQAVPEQIEHFAREVVRLRSEREFRSFWLGTRVRGPVSREDAIAFRRDLNRRVGLRVLELAPDLRPTPEGPEARILMDASTGEVTIRTQSLLVYGRYRKFSREMPQSKWPCRWCHGSGCEVCGGTGKRYERTVEGLVGSPLLSASGAVGTKMHAIGREDVDARMLGDGRPFVLELVEPRVRSFDLLPIQEEIRRNLSDEVEVEQLQFADRSLLRVVTSIKPDKSYRAKVECFSPAPRSSVACLSELRDVVLRQETPRRVLHRRPNRVRRRAVRHCSVTLLDDANVVKSFTLTLRAESGTYVKEFVAGDEGRTTPSIAEILGLPCDCNALDVLAVHCDPLCESVVSNAT